MPLAYEKLQHHYFHVLIPERSRVALYSENEISYWIERLQVTQ